MDIVRRLDALAPIQPTDLKHARATWAEFRGQEPPLLTAPDANTKLNKSAIPNYGLSLAPANLSEHNPCRYATPQCIEVCVAFAGKGELAQVQRGRIWKTQFLTAFPAEFVTLLAWETHKASVKHNSNMTMRLNVFSDIPWERIIPWYFEWASDVRFYDYTKWPAHTRGVQPSNYDLTYSVSERWSEYQMQYMLDKGHRIAVVVPRGQESDITEWRGYPCVNGDTGDLRWLDPSPAIVLLKAKGRARSLPVGGFVRDMST